MFKRLSFLFITLMVTPSFAEDGTEVLHYWTSGGEAEAVQVLQQAFEDNGGTWVDAPVAGGGGDAQAAVLRARYMAGNPPAIAQVKGENIHEWASVGALQDFDEQAAADSWDEILPSVVSDLLKHDGQYMAVPTNIHRTNWLWLNADIFQKLNLASPRTWDEFNAAAEIIKEAGYVPLAHGGQPWQDATLFEVVLLGIGGVEFYNKALVELDEETLRSDTMVKVFDQMRKLSSYADAGASGREWNLATAMVMRDQAAMQIMGDWAKGEFVAAGETAGEDFLCVPTPSSDGFILNLDSVVAFKAPHALEGQTKLAHLALNKEVQRQFSLKKGSIPARMDVSMEGFDQCSLRSMQDFERSQKDGSLVLSVVHDTVQGGAVRGAFLDVVTDHFNTDMSSQEAVKLLAETVSLAQ